jgi:hypothetical protein
MDKTYLDFFNYYLQQFLNEMISYFPNTKRSILDNYRGLLEGRDMKNDSYVKYFMTKTSDCMPEIAKKDISLFNREVLFLVEGINFYSIWNSPEINENNKQAIWKYLQLLLLLGRKIIPNKAEIVDMLKRVGGTIDTPSKTDLKQADTTEDEKDENSTSGLSSILDMAGSLGSIGNLVGGLMGGSSGSGGMDFGNLAQSLSEGLKNVDLGNIVKQFTQSMNPENSNASTSADSADGADGADSADGQADETNTSESSNSTTSNLFNSGLFSDLAKDVASTFDMPKPATGADGATEEKPDMSSTLKQFLSGDNPAKMMNLISKYGTRLQKDLENGKINPASLLQQASQMMGGSTGASPSGMPNLQQMAEMLGADKGAQNRVKNATRAQSTRDRLKQKLENRNANNESGNSS